MHGFISGLSLLFHWSTCLFLCQHHMVLITVVFIKYLEIRKCDTPHPAFFFLRASLALWSLWWFRIQLLVSHFLSQYAEWLLPSSSPSLPLFGLTAPLFAPRAVPQVEAPDAEQSGSEGG